MAAKPKYVAEIEANLAQLNERVSQLEALVVALSERPAVAGPVRQPTNRMLATLVRLGDYPDFETAKARAGDFEAVKARLDEWSAAIRSTRTWKMDCRECGKGHDTAIEMRSCWEAHHQVPTA